MRRTVSRHALVIWLTTFVSACMGYPQNGQHSDDIRDETFFAGRVLVPNQRIDVLMNNRWAGEWVTVHSFRSGTSPVVDAAGTTWYEWSGYRRLPQDPQFWTWTTSMGPSGVRAAASVRARTEDGTELTTFDINAADCFSRHQSGGGFEIMANCASSSSPVVRLTATCGARGAGCCWPSSCASGLLCGVDQECLAPPTSYSSLPDYPFRGMTNWRLHPQGVATDDTHWYIGHEFWIGWTPLTTDLQSTNIPEIRFPDSSSAEHYGDPDVYRGRLYIPVEQGTRGHGVVSVSTDDLRAMGAAAPTRFARLPAGVNHAAWVAINPVNGRMYSSREYESVTSIDEYDFTDDTRGLVLSFRRSITLTGLPFGALERVQGGAFGPDGLMYISSWNSADVRGGVFVFSPEGQYRYRIHLQYNGQEVLEGVTFRELEGGLAPGIAGHVHAIVFSYPPFGSNRIYFKHYRANYP